MIPQTLKAVCEDHVQLDHPAVHIVFTVEGEVPGNRTWSNGLKIISDAFW